MNLRRNRPPGSSGICRSHCSSASCCSLLGSSVFASIACIGLSVPDCRDFAAAFAASCPSCPAWVLSSAFRACAFLGACFWGWAGLALCPVFFAPFRVRFCRCPVFCWFVVFFCSFVCVVRLQWLVGAGLSRLCCSVRGCLRVLLRAGLVVGLPGVRFARGLLLGRGWLGVLLRILCTVLCPSLRRAVLWLV